LSRRREQFGTSFFTIIRRRADNWADNHRRPGEENAGENRCKRGETGQGESIIFTQLK